MNVYEPFMNLDISISFYINHDVQIRLKLINLNFIFMLHYGQEITQVCLSSIFMDSYCHNAVFVYVYGQRITR